MRRVLMTTLFGLAVTLISASSFADSVEARLGAFFPQGGRASQPSSCLDFGDSPTHCNLFLDLSELFGANRKGWEGVSGGIEYNRRLQDKLELGFHIDGYGRTRFTSYVNYTRDDPDQSEIEQELRLSVIPIGLSVRLLPLGARRTLAPYVAVGADLVVWRYSEFGDIIDFDSTDWDVVPVDRSASGVAPGLHVAAGVRVPLSYDFALTAEVRYLKAKVQEMGQPFEVYEIDPSGASATFGVNLRF
jgi:opacity protein-like surface antigen